MLPVLVFLTVPLATHLHSTLHHAKQRAVLAVNTLGRAVLAV